MSASLSLGGFQERAPLRQCGLEELDHERLSSFLYGLFGQATDTERDALRCGLYARAGQSLHPTAVGLLCFGDVPQLQYPQWGLSCVKIQGRAISDPVLVHNSLEGSISVLVDDAMTFLRQHTGMVVLEGDEDEQTSSVETTQHEYAAEGVREILVNALIHRDLKSTARVSITAFDDRLVIRSPGGAIFDPQAFELLSTEGGRSLPRNPLLASTARRLGLCEQIGRGLARARRLSSGLTRLPLQIEVHPQELGVVIPSAWTAHHTN